MVVSILNSRLGQCSAFNIEMGTYGAEYVAKQRKEVAAIRNWLKTQDREIVRAYNPWLSFFESGYAEAEAALARGRYNYLNRAAAAAKAFPQPPRN